MPRIIVQAISSWELPEDNKSGITVNYIDPSLLQEDENTVGIKPLKATLEKTDIRKFPAVPGVYDAEFGMKATGKGKIELYLKDAKFVREFQFSVEDETA